LIEAKETGHIYATCLQLAPVERKVMRNKSFEQGMPKDFDYLLKQAKKRLLRMHYESRVGHIGGNLSALDAMLFLHLNVMQEDDTFVLSKGHAAGALYIALWAAGQLSDEQLRTFHRDGSKLAGHPSAGWHPGIRFFTGSLGHGFSLSAGQALAKKLKNREGHIYCLTSDGEWESGANWEALTFASHHRLDNLTLLLDANGLQGFGTTSDVASLEPLADKISAFGVDLQEIDGHDPAALAKALDRLPGSRPRVVILHTVKGHGVSFMEGRMEWHYLSMTEEQYRLAVEEIEAA
jgi:transketolase